VNRLHLVPLCVLLLVISSCSFIGKRKGGNPDDYATSLGPETVSKAQYDELMRRHQELTERHRLIQQELSTSQGSPDILGELRMASPSVELAETVDAFSGRAQAPAPAAQPPAPRPATTPSIGSTTPVIDGRDVDPAVVEEQILILRNSNELIAQNRFDQALRELRKIENSSIRQIRVRAKFNMGEILFQQGEFDLALQVFEDVIKNDAFSGIVIKTLGRLIVCSERLNLDQRKDVYYSLLHDFLEKS
jgi:TolA-binding protein